MADVGPGLTLEIVPDPLFPKNETESSWSENAVEASVILFGDLVFVPDEREPECTDQTNCGQSYY